MQFVHVGDRWLRADQISHIEVTDEPRSPTGLPTHLIVNLDGHKVHLRHHSEIKELMDFLEAHEAK